MTQTLLCLIALLVSFRVGNSQVTTVPVLPQEPVAKKERSDLEDKGIKGKVKVIEYEMESLRPSDADKGRALRRVEEYNEQGNLLTIRYIRDGVVVSATSYGFVDGQRAFKSAGGQGVGFRVKETTPSDPRFDSILKYKYENGKLMEQSFVSNNGSPGLTRKYKYTDNRVELLIYDPRGKLNQRYLSDYDKNGNEMKQLQFRALSDPNEIEFIRRWTYSKFDGNKNWTQRTEELGTVKGGVENFNPTEIEYRKITYYP